jgi:NitT/TauT family transport system substrate-binding protein
MKFFPVFAAALLLASAARAEHITIGLAIPQGVTDGGGMAAAAELGLFKAEGLEPEFIVFQGAGALLPQIATKQITIGLPLTEPVLASYQPGNAPLPVVFFYNASPYNGMELAVLADGPVHSIADLKGKAIGVGAMTWGTLPQTRSLLRNNGLHPGSDVDIVAVGILGAGFNALRTGRVAALNYNENWIDMLEEQGTKVRRLPFPPAYRRMISNAFVAHQDTLKKDPDLLARFGRVVTEAGFICQANPRFCVDAFWRAHPEAKPKEGDPAQNLADAVATVAKSSEKFLDDDNGHERHFGEFDLGIIRDYVKAMQQSGEFATSDIPLDQLFSNALVPEFVKFDRAALIARAKSAH